MSNRVIGINVMHERDFSNPEDAKEVLAHLGGETLLKEKFPKVYAAYLKTVEKHKNKKRLLAGDAGKKNKDGLENGAFAGAISLTTDKKSNNIQNVSQSNRKADGVISGGVSVQGNEAWTIGYVSGYMKNETDGTMIHSFGRKLDQVNHYETEQQRNSEDLNKFGNQTVRNHIDCSAILKEDGTMVSLNAKSENFILQGDGAPIVYMNIQDPRSYIGNNPILMMYGRMPDGDETVDYDYKDNHIISGTDAVKTLFPVKGAITFSDDMTPIGYSTESISGVPQLQFEGKGVCKYNYTQAEIASCFKISDTNPQVVEFELKEDWNANLDISAYVGGLHQGNIAFHFSFFIRAKIAGTTLEIDQPVCVYSPKNLDAGKTYYESVDDTNAYLPLIFIKWGCFVKDTMIQMADQSFKAVCDLKKGDQILGESGKILAIKDLVSGDEEMIWCIRTKGNKKLEVSGLHPVLTSEGAVRAQEITPKMKVICTDGSEDEVVFNYTKVYKDKVYSIITESGNEWVASNGIWAGDFDRQNDNKLMAKEEETMSDEVRQLSEEFDQLMAHLGVQ